MDLVEVAGGAVGTSITSMLEPTATLLGVVESDNCCTDGLGMLVRMLFLHGLSLSK